METRNGKALQVPGFGARVRLETQVVLERRSLSLRDLDRIGREGLEATDPFGREVELKAGGALVARGRLVRRGDRTWFRVTSVARELPESDRDDHPLNRGEDDGTGWNRLRQPVSVSRAEQENQGGAS